MDEPTTPDYPMLEILFDRMPMGIAIIDREYRLRRFNPTWAAFIGNYTRSDVARVAPGVNIFDLEPGTEEALLPLFERVFAGETVRQDAIRIETEGLVSYWDIVLTPLFEDNRIVGLMDVSIDATRRVLATQELERTAKTLHEREERLGLVMRATNDGIWDWNIETDEVYYSPRWKTMLGYSENEIPDQFDSWRNLVHPDDIDRAMAEVGAYLAGETPAFYLEHRLRHKDGSYRWILARGISVCNQDGKPCRLVGSHTDITDRKSAEEALHESQQLLEQRVRERTHELMTLLDLSINLASTLELEPQLDLILEQLKSVVDYSGASILKREGDSLQVVAYRGPIPAETALQFHFPISTSGANREVIQKRQAVIIPNVRGKTGLARAFQQTAGSHLETSFQYVRAWMGVPLIFRDQVIGMLSLDHPTPGYYQETPHSKLALAFANQVAVAIENARLFSEVRQRADETQALFSVQQAITSRLNVDAVLQMIADEAKRLTNTHQGAVYLLSGEDLVVSVVCGNIGPDLIGYRVPVNDSVAGLAIKTSQPILVNDAQNDPRAFTEIVQKVGARSFLVVPLMASDGPIGTITVSNKRVGELNQNDERVLTILASSAVVALENAQLYQEEQERRRIAEGLRDILAVLNSNRPLDEILNLIVAQAVDQLGSKGGVIYRLDTNHRYLEIKAAFDMPAELMDLGLIPFIQTEANKAILNHQPFAMPDLSGYIARTYKDEASPPAPLTAWANIVQRHFRAYISVPLVVKNEVYGFISLYYAQIREFTKEEIELAVIFADQAALAIENARLQSQAEQAAITAERSRLARDLHDAVTQTLFSASLIAEVLPRLWERSPEEGRRRLEELRQLTRGALAEMRTLLLELRPAALIEAEMNELFRHLTDAFNGRARIPVILNVSGNCALPPEVKVALYRIAQEALNNITKHAGASQATIELGCQPGQVNLTVQDDGRGFDITKIPPEHMGLGIMKERAESIGAKLSITSDIDRGTQVKLVWQPGYHTSN
jgi:PAS domain S-box-containing protein